MHQLALENFEEKIENKKYNDRNQKDLDERQEILPSGT
jgi:hypothetical protein